MWYVYPTFDQCWMTQYTDLASKQCWMDMRQSHSVVLNLVSDWLIRERKVYCCFYFMSAFISVIVSISVIKLWFFLWWLHWTGSFWRLARLSPILYDQLPQNSHWLEKWTTQKRSGERHRLINFLPRTKLAHSGYWTNDYNLKKQGSNFDSSRLLVFCNENADNYDCQLD